MFWKTNKVGLSIFAFACLLFVTSCTSKFSFQKRKYNKGFYVSHSKTPKHIKAKNDEAKPLALNSFSRQNTPKKTPTPHDTLKPESPQQITSSTKLAAIQYLYAAKNFKEVAKSIKPVVHELKKLNKQQQNMGVDWDIFYIVLAAVLIAISIAFFIVLFTSSFTGSGLGIFSVAVFALFLGCGSLLSTSYTSKGMRIAKVIAAVILTVFALLLAIVLIIGYTSSPSSGTTWTNRTIIKAAIPVAIISAICIVGIIYTWKLALR